MLIKLKKRKYDSSGSSVANSTQIKKVKAILEKDSERKIVVVSAPGKRNSSDEKITDLLYQCASLREDGLSFKREYDKIVERYKEIASSLGLDVAFLDSTLEEIRQNIEDGRGSKYASSRGEYLSALLVDGTSLILKLP